MGLRSVTAAQSQHGTADDRVKAASAALQVLESGQSEAAAGLQVSRDAMSKAPDTYLLADRWRNIDTQLGERIDLRAQHVAAQGSISAAVGQVGEAKSRLSSLNQANTSDQVTLNQVKQEAKILQEKLDLILKDDPQGRLTKLNAGASALKEMLRAAAAHATSKRMHDAARQERAKQLDLSETSKVRFEAAEVEAARAQAAVTALTAPVDRAEAAASDLALRLRRHLEPGTDCPVCGSKEHPIHTDGALADIARDMRAQLEAERKALETARLNGTSASRAKETADLSVKQADTALTSSMNDMKNAVSSFAEARGDAVETGLTKMPDHPDGAEIILEDLQDKLRTRRTQIEARIVDQSETARSLERTRVSTAALTSSIEGRVIKRETETALISRVENEISLARQQMSQAQARIASIDTDITPALTAVSTTIDMLDADGQGKREKLGKVVQWWQGHKAAFEDHQEKMKLNEPKISAGKAELDGLTQNLAAALKSLTDRKTALTSLKEKRAALLGGEDTETHRTRHNEVRLKALSTKEEKDRILSDVRSTKSAADERLSVISASLVPASEERDDASALLDQQMAPQGFTRDELKDLLAEGPEAITTLRDNLKAVDAVLGTARATLLSRTSDHADLLEKGVPEESEADLRQSLGETEVLRDETRERIGAISGRLQADDLVRASLRSLQTEIDAARAECDTWAAVNEAVGSRQGGKFAQIAQSVTLSMLVDRANDHLGDLKPRYQLVQGGDDLALHIVDLDMGDEVRSTRSLSGGERFLVSLALALALSSMGGHGGLAATLFIDEGFGSLDAESLDIAMDALETLQAQGRTIGVISHVEAMKDRIPVQVRITRHGSGASSVALASAA